MPSRSRGTRTRPTRSFRPACSDALEARQFLSTLPVPSNAPPDLLPVDSNPVEIQRLASPRSVAPTARNLVYSTRGDNAVRLDVYLPRGNAPESGWPVVLAIHGGGWRRFSKDGYGRDMARALVPQGFAVVAPNYVLAAPGRPTWPLNFEQLGDAVNWIHSQSSIYSFDPTRIASLGESAGGHLAALLGTYPQVPLPNPPTSPFSASARVRAVVNFYGPVDLPRIPFESPTADLAVRQFLGTTFAADPARYFAASPVRWVGPDSAPMLILQGTADTLVPPSQSQSLAEALTRAGVPNKLLLIPGASHGFRFSAGGLNLLPTVVDFLRTHLSLGPT